MIDLILGQATIEVPRVGLIPTTALTLLLSDPDTRIRPALHDPTTGALTDLAARTHRPHRPVRPHPRPGCHGGAARGAPSSGWAAREPPSLEAAGARAAHLS